MAALDENGTLGQLAESQAWFDALDPRTPREDIDRIVEEAIPCFDPLIDYFDQVDWADWMGNTTRKPKRSPTRSSAGTSTRLRHTRRIASKRRSSSGL